MTIIVFAPSRKGGLHTWPRRWYRTVGLDEATPSKITGALKGADLILITDGAMTKIDEECWGKLGLHHAPKVALYSAPPSTEEFPLLEKLDLIVSDGILDDVPTPVVDADLSDATLTLRLIDALVPYDPLPWRVYLLRCGDGTYYTGVSNDPATRLLRHMRGDGARYTRGRGPLRLLALSPPLSQGEALSFEAHVKKRLLREEKPSAVRKGP